MTYLRREIPLYERVEALQTTIIGTVHDRRVEQQGPKRYRFERTITSADHFIAEGNLWAVEQNRHRPEKTWDALAFRLWKEQIHLLEEGKDVVTTLGQYGVAKALVPVYFMLHHLPGCIDSRVGPRELFNLLHQVAAKHHELQGTNETHPKETVGLVVRAIIGIGDAAHDAANTFHEYRSNVREYEFLIPGTVQLARDLEGEKVVLTGADHVPGIAAALQGETPQQPADWPTVVQNLQDKRRLAIQRMESDLLELLEKSHTVSI